MSDAAHFKDRLHHRVSPWVSDGEAFHIRIRCHSSQFTREPLTSPSLARALLDSARYYHWQHRWHCYVILLMPDHVHMLAMFSSAEGMSRVVHDWKRWHTREHAVTWQDGYFDHRIRSGHEFELKAHYIRQNPVVKELCTRSVDWPWFCEPARADG